MPHFGRLQGNVFYAQGYSGHGVALAGLAGKLIAGAIAGDAEKFDILATVPTSHFPRRPLFALARAGPGHAVLQLERPLVAGVFYQIEKIREQSAIAFALAELCCRSCIRHSTAGRDEAHMP